MSMLLEHEPILFPASQAATLNGSTARVVADDPIPEIAIALIDARVLLGEVLLSALKMVDAPAQYTLYPSGSSWLESYQVGERTVVLLSIDPQPGRTPDDCKRDLQMIRKAAPNLPVIIISSEESPEAVLNALELGADAYASTSLNVRAIVQIIRLVQAGDRYVPAAIFQALMRRSSGTVQDQPEQEALLSPREMLVAKALRKGTPNKVIAYELNMCESTVKVHVRHIMKKLKAKNRTQVAFLTNAMFDD